MWLPGGGTCTIQRLWPPWSAACDCQSVLFSLPSGSLSQVTLQFLCSLVLHGFHREEEGVRSPRLVGDRLLLPLAQPGFLMAPACCYWVASSQWFRFPLDWWHLPLLCSLFPAVAPLWVTSLFLMVSLSDTATMTSFCCSSCLGSKYRLSSCQKLDSVNTSILTWNIIL